MGSEVETDRLHERPGKTWTLVPRKDFVVEFAPPFYKSQTHQESNNKNRRSVAQTSLTFAKSAFPEYFAAQSYECDKNVRRELMETLEKRLQSLKKDSSLGKENTLVVVHVEWLHREFGFASCNQRQRNSQSER